MSLQNYITDKQTALFTELGAIFAFSNEQFHTQKQEGVTYVSLGAGLLVPKDNVKSFKEKHKIIIDEGIAQDIKDNGKENIIKRELDNYECYYTGDYTDCVEALDSYGFTEDDIRAVFYHRS